MKYYTRYCVVRRGCHICLAYLKAISKINSRLSPEKQIVIIDNYRSEEYKLQPHPVVAKFEKEGFHYYPFCYVDGFIIEPAPPQILFYTFKGLLREDFIYQ